MFKGSRTLNLSCALGVALAVLHVPQVYAAADMAFTAEDGLKVRLGNDAALRVGSRIHADSVSFSEDLTPLGDATDFRRARLASRLDLGDFRVRADYDVGVSRGWKNLFLEYRGLRRQRFVVGNHVAPFSMEDADGSSVMALMERSAASALNPGMLLGASYRTWGDRWSLSGGVFTNAMDDLDRRQGAGRSVIARATFAPLRGEHSVLHLGLSGERRTIDNGERVRLRARPFSRLAERRLVDTGGIDDVDSLRNVGIEFGAAHWNFRVQGEAYRASLATVTGPVDFDGQYISGEHELWRSRLRIQPLPRCHSRTPRQPPLGCPGADGAPGAPQPGISAGNRW